MGRLLNKAAVCTVALAALICGAACDSKKAVERGSVKISVVATTFPLYEFARAVGGEKADVRLLLPPGVEAHSFEPTPGDVIRINQADLFIWTGRAMEPWAESLLKGRDTARVVAVDASRGIRMLPAGGDGHEAGHRGHGKGETREDPHIWLNFAYAEQMVDNIVAGFAEKDPASSEYYRSKGRGYKERLRTLDETFRKTLSNCRTRTFIHGGHFAFGYLAERYGLTYFSLYGFSPNSEPSARCLAEIVATMKKHKTKYIFYEELIEPRVARIVARETGATLLPLNPGAGVTREEFEKGVTFISLMEENLQNLNKGLGCTTP